MKIKKWLELIPLFIVSAFPILSLASKNIKFIHLNSIIRSLVITALFAMFFYTVIFLFLKDKNKSIFLSSALILFLLTYGNLFSFLESRFEYSFNHTFVLSIIMGLFIFLMLMSFKISNKTIESLNESILVGGSIMILYLLFSIGINQFKVFYSESRSGNSPEQINSSLSKREGDKLPDIYLILLDGHTRSDVLNDVYGYDNSDFIEKIEDLGFWVAECGQSNYPSTNFSLTSLFEMDYLHNVYDSFENLVFPPLNNTNVFQVLENNDYSIVTFQNFVFEHFNINNDFRYSKEKNLNGSINEFEKMVVDNSIIRVLMDMRDFFPDYWIRPFTDNLDVTHYRDTLYTLNTLPKLPETDEEKFVFAHLLVTHDPFVFMADGSFNPSKIQSATDYRNAAEFIDNTIPEIVEEIIDNSNEPPIIIIMGDHGASYKANPIEERLSILFSIYLQGNEPENFYKEISPVNVFRLIFNYLFDAKLDLIDDIGYGIWNIADLDNVSNGIVPTCTP